MTKKMNVYDLPIYKEHYDDLLKIIIELEILKEKSFLHKKLIDNAYNRAILIFPNLNAGYQQFIS